MFPELPILKRRLNLLNDRDIKVSIYSLAKIIMEVSATIIVVIVVSDFALKMLVLKR
jgi:hypothetical protein